MIQTIRRLVCVVFPLVLLMCSPGLASDFVIINPPTFEGTAAINPALRTWTPTNLIANENLLEAAPGLLAIHDFEFDGNASTTNSYIFDSWSSGAIDVQLKYSGNPIGTVATTASTYSTSASGALRLQAGQFSAVSLQINFGTWSTNAVFFSNQVTEAAGLTLSTSAGSTSTPVQIYVIYYDTNGVALTTQQMSTTAGTSYHCSGYSSSNPISYIVVSYTNAGWAPVVTIDDLAYVSSPWIWHNPSLVQGSNAVDPTGGADIKVNASGSVSQTTMESLAGFSAIQNWTMGPSWSRYGLGTNQTGIIAFTNFFYPDVSLKFRGNAGLSCGNRISNGVWGTSYSTSLRIVAPSGSLASNFSLTLDFGEWNGCGFDEKSSMVKAAAFTIGAGSSSHWQNVSSLRATFFDIVGNVLSTQQVASADWSLLRNASTGGAVYFGFISAYTNISSVRIDVSATNSAVLGLDDFGFTPCNLFAESFAGQVERLRGVSGVRAEQLTVLLDDIAQNLATTSIWGRAYSINDMTNTTQANGVKYVDTSSKYFAEIGRMGAACALMYALACNDIGVSSEILKELPYMAAAYRLCPAAQLRTRLTNQLCAVTNWVPFQRPGWTLAATSTNWQTNVVDGVFLATGNMIQALALTLNILPADFFLDNETLRKHLYSTVTNQLELTHSDWVNQVPWYVAARKYDSNQWVVPASGMVIGSACLGKEANSEIYNYGIDQLTNSLNFVGSDGSMSEGYGYGLSYVMTALLLTKRTMESAGDSQWGAYQCFTGMPVWAAMCFQPNSNVVNSFDWYDGQRTYGVQSLEDIIQQMGVVSDDNTSRWLLNNIYEDPAPTVFGLLCLGADSATQSAPPLYASFSHSPMFIWRSSWTNQLSAGIWIRGGDTRDYHDHWDRGHVNMIFNGRPILIEAGTPGYADVRKSSHYDSVVGHNVLQIGTNIYPAKGASSLTATTGISQTTGLVTFTTGSTSNSAYYDQARWDRRVSWNCGTTSMTAVIEDTVTSTNTNKLTFRWHLATTNNATVTTGSNGVMNVTILNGNMVFSGETVSTPRIDFEINSSNTPITITSTSLYDHTLKHGNTTNLHTAIQVSTISAVSNFVMRTTISTANSP